MSVPFDFDPGYPPDVECVICLNPWTAPVELQPCGHVFCHDCVETVATCPSCRGPINGRHEPNRVLRNIVHSLPGKCGRCGWRGVRGQHLESHSLTACDAYRDSSSNSAPPPGHAVSTATVQEFVRPVPLPEDEPPLTAQSSTDFLSAPDSAAAFMAFFVAAQPPPPPPPPPSFTPPPQLPAHLAAGIIPPSNPHLLPSARPVAPARPFSPGEPGTDDASSPQLSQGATLAVAIIRGLDGAVPPLDYHTVSAPLDACTGEAILIEMVPELLREEAATTPGCIPVALIVGDQILNNVDAPLASLGVQHGAVMYILCEGAEIDDRALELFRVRSLLDELIRLLRIAEASPRRSQAAMEAEHPAADTELMRWSGQLTDLLLRLDNLESLPPPLRSQKRRACQDAAQAEELLDRLKGLRGARSRNASLAAAAPSSGQVDFAFGMQDEPWLMYNLSQRFYDSLLAAFAAFDEGGRGVLNRAQITRVCRWMNLPSDGQTIGDLFSMFCGASTQAQHTRAASSAVERTITFHQLCVWVQRQQRRPLHDYGLTFDRYSEALDLAHALDTDHSGALTQEEAVRFLRRFAGKDAARAEQLVDGIIQQMRLMLAMRATPGAAGAAGAAAAAPAAAIEPEEIPLDIVLRVLCSEAQGWDVCEVEPPPAARPAAATAAAPIAQPQNLRASTTSTQRPRGATTGSSADPRAAQASGGTPAPQLAASSTATGRFHRLRSATTTTDTTRRRKEKDKCIVA
jgi:hypothetical protein